MIACYILFMYCVIYVQSVGGYLFIPRAAGKWAGKTEISWTSCHLELVYALDDGCGQDSFNCTLLRNVWQSQWVFALDGAQL